MVAFEAGFIERGLNLIENEKQKRIIVVVVEYLPDQIAKATSNIC